MSYSSIDGVILSCAPNVGKHFLIGAAPLIYVTFYVINLAVRKGALTLKNNLVLIGFMGTGKTSLGKMLASKLGCAFVDLDQKIEADSGMSIPDIFRLHGEDHFRRLERQAVAEVAERRGIVIATGGGTVKDPNNVKLLREHGLIICLTCSVDEILERTAVQGERPVLDSQHQSRGDRRAAIEKLLNERQKFYAQADYTLDTTAWSLLALVDNIIKYVRSREA